MARSVARRARGLALLVWVVVCGCEQPYRIGEYVLVEWEEGQPPYPAYIIANKGKARYRVHYDGYANRWDQEVTIDRIKGRVEGHVLRPPPPKKVLVAQGFGSQPKTSSGSAKASASATPTGQYKAGDRVKVRWRGTVYPATILKVVATDQYLVHYDGYESAWDETVAVGRIVSTR